MKTKEKSAFSKRTASVTHPRRTRSMQGFKQRSSPRQIASAGKRSNQSSDQPRQTRPSAAGRSFVKSFWGVRYQVKDVSRSVSFYTQQLGFKLDHQHLPAFGQVSSGHLKL